MIEKLPMDVSNAVHLLFDLHDEGQAWCPGREELEHCKAELEKNNQESEEIKCFFSKPTGVRFLLFLYCFLVLVIIEFLSATRNGAYILIKDRYILLLSCLLLIEILNQITFWMNRKSYKNVVFIRGIFFWLIFTLGMGLYLYKLSSLECSMPYPWQEGIFRILIYFVLSLITSHYSLVPEFRFFLLRGKFKEKREK